jgi:hypothetical protein
MGSHHLHSSPSASRAGGSSTPTSDRCRPSVVLSRVEHWKLNLTAVSLCTLRVDPTLTSGYEDCVATFVGPFSGFPRPGLTTRSTDPMTTLVS